MFRELIEGIRNAFSEGEGSVYQVDRYARQRSTGNKYLKAQASRLRRRGNKIKIKKGEHEKVRDDVRKGYAT